MAIITLRAVLRKCKSILDSDDAAHTIDGAMEQWPDQGDVWLMRLRLDAARNDGDALRHTVQQIESKHIYLGGQGRRVLRFWTGTKEAERA